MGLEPSAALLTDRVAVVTGGGRGIGRGIAGALATFGARVAVWEQDADTCARAAGDIGGLACPADVRDADQVDAVLARTISELGPPSILVNNAGGVFWSPLLETAPKGWDALLRANLGQVLLCTQRVARAMVEAGAGGSVINVTSSEGTRAAPGFAAYAAAKAGVISLTQTAALELAPHRIRVNALAPDVILTEGILGVAPNPDHLPRAIPMGRTGTVDEMGGAAVFLASNLSSYVTGETIHVDGGTHAAGGWYPHPDDGHYVLGPAD